MKATENIYAVGQKVPALRTAGRVAVVAALAAIIFVAVWPPTSAGVTQSDSSLRDIKFDNPSLAGVREQNDRANDGDQIARDYIVWLSAAHARAAVTAEDLPLPAQF